MGYLGTMFRVDNATLRKDRMTYARVIVDLNINKGFLNELFDTNQNER